MAKCDQCRKEHTRKRFCSNRCKDRYHNRHNPRGMARTVSNNTDIDDSGYDPYGGFEEGWDGHKDAL